MKIKMLKTEKGSEDGIKVQEFEEGSVYDVTEKLAKIFVGLKSATFAKEEVAEMKGLSSAPENKDAKTAKDKKDSGSNESKEE